MKEASKGRRDGRKRVLALLVVVAGATLLAGSIGGLLYVRALREPGVAPLPDSISGLELSASASGREAVEIINRLHGQGFSLTSAAVGTYGSAGEIQLWVSGAGTKWFARRLVSDMGESIAETDTPFTPLGERNAAGRPVFELKGLGKRHFYFQSGSLLVWMAVAEGLAEDALSDCLEVYPRR